MNGSRNCAVLLYCEDPGAANFFIGLPDRLKACGLEPHFYTSGAATTYLEARDEFTARLADRDPAMLLATDNPILIAVGTSENPDSPALAFIDAARKLGIETVGVVDHDANASFRFRGRSKKALHHAPDYLIVPDSLTAQAYTALGYHADQIATCGHPQFDRAARAQVHLAQRGRDALRREHLPEAGDRKIIVFLAEQSFSLDPNAPECADETAYPGRQAGRNRIEAVLDAVLDACRDQSERPYVVVRLHPKNDHDAFAKYDTEIDMISAQGDPLPLLYCADLVIGLTTVLLGEAHALGRPVIAAPARAEEFDWLPGTLRTADVAVRDAEALAHRINTVINVRSEPPTPAINVSGSDAGNRICVAIANWAKPPLERRAIQT